MKIRNWDKVKEGTLLVVTWHDIRSDDRWLEDTEAQSFEPAICKNVGWFVNDDKLNIRITSSVADDGDKSIVVIPKGCVRDVRKISYTNS